MSDSLEFIQIWAKEFKKNPDKNRKLLIKFVSEQISLAQDRLNKLPIEKLIKLFDIKNQKVIEMLSKKQSKK
ncbi:MAG: hypothetical protein ACTSRS_04385 [Candidatus Helarchaeota archaeon]